MTGMGERKRIAFLCHTYHRGGVTRWMADAAIAFSRSGWDTYFLAPDPKYTFHSGVGRETMLNLISQVEEPIHVITRKVGYEFEFGSYDYRKYIYQKLLQNISPGIPVVVSDDAAVWDAAAVRYRSNPVIGVLHSDHSKYYDLALRYSLQVDIIACVSGRIQKKLIELSGNNYRSNSYLIPCGINLFPFKADERSKNEILEIVYTARLVKEAKRLGDLVKICRELKIRNAPFHLHIIGDGAERRNLEKEFDNNNLSSAVSFYGWLERDDVINKMSESDMVVLTSDFEGLPIVMMESLAAGCAFLGTRVSGIEDYEDCSGAELCFGVYAVGDIADAVDKVIRLNNIKPITRKKAARAMAEKNFSMETCINKYTAAIADLHKYEYKQSEPKITWRKLCMSFVLATIRNCKMYFSGHAKIQND